MNPLICYALKANFNQKIVQTLSKLGAGMDVVSGGELRLSNECGVDKNKIVLATSWGLPYLPKGILFLRRFSFSIFYKF